MKVEAYETTDGKLFRHIQDADEHQYKLDFLEWYPHNILAQGISAENLLNWILENEEAVRMILPQDNP